MFNFWLLGERTDSLNYHDIIVQQPFVDVTVVFNCDNVITSVQFISS